MALAGETRTDFKSGADRNSLKFNLEDRLEKNGSFFLKGPSLTFEAQKGVGVDFFKYGATRTDLDTGVRQGNTTGANRFRTPNEVHDIEAQTEATIYRKGPNGKLDSDREFGTDFFTDATSGGTSGFRQNSGRDKMAMNHGQPTEFNADNSVFRKAMPAPGGYSAPGITTDSGRGPGGNYFDNQGDSRKNLKGFTRNANLVNVSDYGNNDPLSAAEASVYRDRMNTDKYEFSF